LQQQISQLTQQLHVVQQRAEAKDASSRKYKEACRAFKVPQAHSSFGAFVSTLLRTPVWLR
jgi:hypothetical protein